MRHERALVLETVFQQELDCVRAVVPGRRAVSERAKRRRLFEGFEPALEHPAFFVLGPGHRDFRAGNRGAPPRGRRPGSRGPVRVGLDGMTGDEEGRLDVALGRAPAKSAAPRRPSNSPREIVLGEFEPRGPIQIQSASKSKVRQTVAGGAYISAALLGLLNRSEITVVHDIQARPRPHVWKMRPQRAAPSKRPSE